MILLMENLQLRNVFCLIRIGAAIGFAVLFVYFLAPLTVRIFNIGNAFGAAVCLAAAAVLLFWQPFIRLVGRIWQLPVGKALLSVTGTAVVCGAVLCIVLSGLMLGAMHDPPEDSSTTLVVLGCKVRESGPSLMLIRRLDKAADYLEAHPDIPVVVSGGKGDDEPESEAECMRRYLSGRGIAADRIYMEDRSADTEENLKYSMQVIEDNGLEPHITIVTDGFHQYRAELLSRKLGLNAYNISSATPGWLLPTYWVREWFGIVYYKVLGKV